MPLGFMKLLNLSMLLSADSGVTTLGNCESTESMFRFGSLSVFMGFSLEATLDLRVLVYCTLVCRARLMRFIAFKLFRVTPLLIFSNFETPKVMSRLM